MSAWKCSKCGHEFNGPDFSPCPNCKAEHSFAASAGSASEIESALALCHRLRDGAARMTRQQFRNCLKRSIGANKDYADGVRVSFQNNPAAFLAHRNPQTQSQELLRVILEITQTPNAEVSGRRADDSRLQPGREPAVRSTDGL